MTRVSLHTATHGSGPAVVFVHGYADSSDVWEGTVAELAESCTCTTIDLPGHGHSEAPVDTAAYQRESVLAAFDDVLAASAVASAGPAVFVGHSLGGYLGLAHHLTRPGVLRGLVLVSAGPGFRDESAMSKWNERVLENTAALDVPPEAAAISLHVDSLVIDGLGDVSIPVGLVVGSDDKAFLGANDYMEAKFPDVRRCTVEGGRHRVMRTHPEAVASMVQEVIAAAHS